MLYIFDLLWFTWRMHKMLWKNRHKGGWDYDHSEDLLVRLKQEISELEKELNNPYKHQDQKLYYPKVVNEAADVANFAMMIATKYREANPRFFTKKP